MKSRQMLGHVKSNKSFFNYNCLHQGLALSPFLFATVIEEMTRSIQIDVPWCMVFADDIVLVDETEEGVNVKLE